MFVYVYMLLNKTCDNQISPNDNYSILQANYSDARGDPVNPSGEPEGLTV